MTKIIVPFLNRSTITSLKSLEGKPHLRNNNNVGGEITNVNQLSHLETFLLSTKKMAADQVQFTQILNSLLSTDNDVRQQAEVSSRTSAHVDEPVQCLSWRIRP